MLENLPHRWERDAPMRGWRCVEIPIDGVEDGTRCKGCGIIAGDKLVHEIFKGEHLGLGWRVMLDLIVDG